MTFVVANIFGGLGNQMFQYAAGRALALRFQVPLKLDIRDFRWHWPRVYELQKYSIFGQIAGPHDLAFFEGGAPPAVEKFNETQFYRYDKRIEMLRPPVYLNGYWQTELYF